MKFALPPCLAWLCMAAVASLRAQDLVGLEISSGTLFRVDRASGDLTAIGSTGLLSPAALEFSPDGTLYALTAGSNPSLYTIDPFTGSATWIDDLNVGFLFEGGLAFAPNGLAWATNQGDANNASLVKINLFTGEASVVGRIGNGFYDIGGLGYRSDGLLIGLNRKNNNFVILDPNNAAVLSTMPVQPGVGGSSGMVVISDDLGYFTTAGPGNSIPGSNELWAFHPMTGQHQLVGELSGGSNNIGLAGLASLGEVFSLEDLVPGQAGVINSVTFSFATNNAQVAVAYGLLPGFTEALPLCPGTFLEIDNARMGGVTTADSSGSGSLSAFISPALSGRTLYLQAVDLNNCAVSNLVAHPFP